MSAPSYICKDRHGGYLFRITIPIELRRAFQNKHSLRQSLQTYHRPTAIKQARRLAVEAMELFDMTLEKYIEEKNKAKLTIKSAEVKKLRLEEELSPNLRLELEQKSSKLTPELQAFMDKYEQQDARKKTATKALEMLSKKIEIASKIELRQSVIHDYKLSVPSTNSSGTHDPSIPLSEAFDEFIKAKQLEGVKLAAFAKGPKGSQWGGYTAIFKLFLACTSNKPVSEINTADLNKYKQVVPLIPSDIGKQARDLLAYDYETLAFNYTINQITEAAKDRSLKLLSQKSIQDYYVHIKTFLRWASRENDYLSTIISEKAGAIMAEKKIPDTGKNKREENYPEYTQAQLKQIFSCPIFDTTKAYEPTTNARRLRPSDFWMPILALYTGARGTELAQLHTSDIQQKEGIWCININDRAEDKKTKGKGEHSNRLVPIHNQLVKIGLLDFHLEQQKESQKYLFPELREHKTGKENPYKKWGSWYDRMILQKYINIGTERKPVFHSFRDTFISELKRNKVHKENRVQLVGHSIRGDAHERYSKDLSLDLISIELNKAIYKELSLNSNWRDFKRIRLA